MITAGEITPREVRLKAQSEASADIARSLLSGKAGKFDLPPFGNQITVEVSGASLRLVKKTTNPYLFEEVFCIIRKLQSSQMLENDVASELMNMALTKLGSRTTLFFPSKYDAVAEENRIISCFGYGWVGMSFGISNFKLTLPDIKEALNGNQNPSSRMFYGEGDSISIVHFDAQEMHLSAKAVTAIATAFKDMGVMEEGQVRPFTLGFCATQLASLIIFEAMAANPHVNERIDVDKAGDLSSDLGSVEFLCKLLHSCYSLAQHGDFGALSMGTLEVLHGAVTGNAPLSGYNLVENIHNSAEDFIRHFSKDITKALEDGIGKT